MERLGTVFAQNMKAYRRKCGLTQAQLAEKVDVSTHHIGMIELTRNFPTFDLIERLAKALDIEIYELFVEPHSTPIELERLRQDIVNEVKLTVSEAISKGFADRYKDQLTVSE